MSSQPQITTGTGDGRAPLRSRKITSFVLLVLAILAILYVGSRIGAPENVTIQAMWIVGMGGYVVIGGQSLVDAILKSRWGATATGESRTVIEKSTVVSSSPTGTGTGQP